MHTDTSKKMSHDEVPHLEVISMEGTAINCGDIFPKDLCGPWKVRDICYSLSSSARCAEAMANEVNKECWVVDRTHGNQIKFRFKPAPGITLN